MSSTRSDLLTRRDRWWRSALIGGALMVAGALIAWAVLSVMRPASDVLEATDYTFAEVSTGEVGASLRLNTVAQWTSSPVGSNRADGVVNSVEASSGDDVGQGDVLYTVDLRPVVIAEGPVPMFRDVGAEASGGDVRQIQQLLADLGYYTGPVEGEAGSSTVDAIRAWQGSLGVEQTGVVPVGDVVFVPSLPTRIVLDSELIVRGATLAGGEAVVSALSETPDFTLPVTDAQSALIPTGARVEITSPEDDVWPGQVSDRDRDAETGIVTIHIEGEDDAGICGDDCAQIPASGESMLSTVIVTVETVTGLMVPSSAIVTDVNGQTLLIDEDGERLEVTVVASAQGMSIVEGVEDGTRVRVPGDVEG